MKREQWRLLRRQYTEPKGKVVAVEHEGVRIYTWKRVDTPNQYWAHVAVVPTRKVSA